MRLAGVRRAARAGDDWRAGVRFGSRNEELTPNSLFFGGRPVACFDDGTLAAIRYALDRHGFAEAIVFGEVVGPGIQKGVRYTPDGSTIFRAFDIMVDGAFVDYDDFFWLCERAGLPRVPELYRGPPSLASFDALLERQSDEARRNGVEADDNLAEGVVIRAVPMGKDSFGDWLIIKHKSERFTEVSRAPREPKVRTTDDGARDFAAAYVTEGRLVNALGRLRSRNAPLVDAVADMPLLIPEVLADLQSEQPEEWAAAGDEKQIRGAVSWLVGSIYRQMLVQRAA